MARDLGPRGRAARHEEFNPFAAEMIRYQLASCGKRVRPALVLIASKDMGGDLEAGLPFAATVELIHNASLVHDDIQDKDTTRRGRPAAWVTFSTEQAINLGDLLFVLGFEAMSRMPVPERVKLEIIGLTIRAIGELVDGQVYEFILKERDRVGMDEYYRLVDGKTGSLFKLACVGGAALAAAGPDASRDMKTVGEHLGVMFQIRDDLLDVIGHKEGWPAGSDIEEGKISFLAVRYMEVASEADRARLLEVLRMPRSATTRKDVEDVIDRYRRTGCLEAALDTYNERRRAVLSVPCLERFPALGRDLLELLEELDPKIAKEELG